LNISKFKSKLCCLKEVGLEIGSTQQVDWELVLIIGYGKIAKTKTVWQSIISVHLC